MGRRSLLSVAVMAFMLLAASGALGEWHAGLVDLPPANPLRSRDIACIDA
jgi:hypothetical protein